MRQRNKKLLFYMLRDFCKKTKLPGFKFLILPKRTLTERIFWIIVMITSISTGWILAGMTITPSSETQIVTDSIHYLVKNFYYPAVTVCNINKISKEKAFKLAKLIKSNKTWVETAYELRDLSHLIFFSNLNLGYKKNYKIQQILKENNLNAAKIMVSLSPKCSDFLTTCRWAGEERPCTFLLQEYITSDGVCCTFNYFALNKLSLPKNVSESEVKFGAQESLQVTLKSNYNDYFATIIPSYGFTLKLHHPFETSEFSRVILLKDNLFNYLYVSPSTVIPAENVVKMSIADRKCLLHDEKKLDILEKYTYENCLLDCKIKLIFHFCGCIPFYYYNAEIHGFKKICDLDDILCLSSYKGIYLNTTKIHNCKCLPECQSTYYSAELTTRTVSRENVEDDIATILYVSYVDVGGLKSSLVASFDWSNILASLAGLVGLFMGLTVVTVIEMFISGTSFVKYLINKNKKISVQ